MNFLAAGVIIIALCKISYAGEPWQPVTIVANASYARAIAIDKNNPDIIYVGFKEALYKTIDQGKSWKLLAPGLITKINFLYIDNENTETIYAACQDGLFRSRDSGLSWQKIFLGKDVSEQNVLSVVICYQAPKSIFLATGSGLFFSLVNRISWQKVAGKLSDARIVSIAPDSHNSDTLFIISSRGLFKTENRMSSYERLYGGFNREAEDAVTDVDSGEEEITPQDYFFLSLAVDPKNSNNIYLGSLKGLLFSPDGGKNWKKCLFSGLLDEKIHYILISEGGLFEYHRAVENGSSCGGNRIFLATQNGVFDCRGDSCKQLYPGADFKSCNHLALSPKDELYVASDKGLYLMSLRDNKIEGEKSENINKNLSLPKEEPTIQQIQKEAVKYAEVYPEKIANWRKQARIGALLPEVDLSYDKTVYTSTSFPQGRSFIGPLDWGVTLSWDLGDLIFSPEQTSIDVRSRLMVQLRDDILNEVTRLYFERKRIQFELDESENIGQKAKAEKDLRLQELSASIDALTGGYLTKSLKVPKE